MLLSVCKQKYSVLRGVCLALTLAFSITSHAQQGPSTLNVSGGLFLPSGLPVTAANVNFRIEIYDKASTCMLYTENHLGVDLSASKGGFALPIGRGTSINNLLESTTALSAKVFENNGFVAGGWANCPSGATMLPGDERTIRVHYDLGGGFVAMSPDVPIASAAYAMVAESIQGKRPTDFINVRDDMTYDLTQGNVENVFSATNYTRLQQLLNPTAAVPFAGQRLSNIADPSSAQDATTKNYSDTRLAGQTIDLVDVAPGFGGGKVLTWDQVAGKWVAMTQTVVGTAGGDLSGTYPNPVVANLAIGTSKLADNAVTSAKISTTGLAPNQLVITDATTGATLKYATCANNEILRFVVGTGWQCTTAASLSAVLSVNGKSGVVVLNGADLGLGTASMRDVGVAATNVPELDAGGKLDYAVIPNFAGDLSGAFNAAFVKGLQGRLVADTAPNAGEVLRWNGTLTRWEPSALVDNVGITALTGDISASGTGSVTATLTNGVVTTPKMFTTPGANRLVATDATTGATLVPFVCNLNESLRWTASGWACANPSTDFIGSNVIVDGGNSRGADISIGTTDNYAFNFKTNNTNKMTILPNGNVGIGTTAPASALSVAGSVAATGAVVAGTNVTAAGNITAGGGVSATTNITAGGDINATNVYTSGNVGVGTTSPSRLLSVNGLINMAPSALPGTPAAGDIAIDSSASNSLKYHNGTSWISLAVGGTGDFLANGSVPMTGQFRSITGTAAAPGMSFVGDIDNGIFAPAADNFAITTSGSEKLRVLANGNVGIGITNPSYALDVNGTINGTGSRVGAGASTAYQTLSGASGGILISEFAGLKVIASGNNPISFETNGPERLRINANGNVGIGTSTPSRLLSVNGSINVAPSALPGMPAAGDIAIDSSASNSLKYHNGTSWISLAVGGTGDFLANGSVPMTGQFRSIAGTAAAPGMTFVGDTDNGIFAPTADNFAITTSGSEKLRVLANGNVGIGTSAPASALEVQNDQNSSTSITVRNNSNTGLAQSQLALNSTGGSLQIAAESNSAGGLAKMQYNGAGISTSATGATGYLAFTTGGNTAAFERMRVSPAGNLGIGTTNPASLLDVSSTGATASTEYLIGRFNNGAGAKGLGLGYVQNAAGTAVQEARVRAMGAVPLALGTSNNQQALFITDAPTPFGAIGIGTTSPATALEVRSSNATIPPNSGTTTTAQFRLSSAGAGAVLDMGVVGGATVGSYLQSTTFSNMATSQNLFLNPNGGLVGIGTTSPTRLFSVNGLMNITPSALPTPAFAGDIAIDSTASNSLKYHNGTTWISLAVGGTGDFRADGSVPMTGQFRSIAGNAAAPGMAFVGDTDNGIFAPAADNFAVSTSGSEKLRILANGNIGMGLSAPGEVLDVAGNIKGYRFKGTGGTEADPGVQINGVTQGMYSGTTNTLGFTTSSIERLRLAANGHVGIGTTNPLNRLSVIDPAKTQINFAASTGSGGFLTSMNSQQAMISAGADYDGTNFFARATTATFVNQNQGSINFTSDTGLTVGNVFAPTSRMFIANTGNVGIGTTSPSRLLSVNGSINVAPSALPGTPAAGDIAIDSAASNSLKYHNGTSWISLAVGGTGDFRADGTVAMTGQLRHLAGTASAPGLTFVGDTDNGIFAPAADNFAVSTAGSERLRVLANGYVGIGMSAPVYNLDVAGRINASTVVSIGSSANAGTVNFRRATGTTTAAVGYLNAAETNNFNFANIGGSGFFTWTLASGEAMRMTDTGLVGIGTTSPSRLLSVNGAINVAPSTLPGTPAAGDIAIDSGASNSLKYHNGTSWISLAVGGTGDFRADGSVPMSGQFRSIAGTAGAPGLSFVGDTDNGMFAPAADNLAFGTSGSEKLRILANGNVGIGTTGPATQMHLRSGVNGANLLTVENVSSGNAARAGIDVTNHAGNSINLRVFSNTFTNSGLRIANTGSVVADPNLGSLILGTQGVSPLIFGTNDLQRMRIDSSGNVGIGTTGPSRLLSVNGAINVAPSTLPGTPAAGDIAIDSAASNSLKYHNGTSWISLAVGGTGDFRADGSVPMTGQFRSIAGTQAAPGLTFVGDTDNGIFAPAADNFAITTAGAERLRVLANGNVGIGTTNPSSPLDVNGLASSNGLVVKSGAQLFPTMNGLGINLTAGGDFVVNSSSIVPLITVKQAGGLGVGTTNPSRLLQVAGAMKLTPTANPGTPTAGDIFVDSSSSNALKYHNGSNWVSIGSGSGDFMADGSVPMTGQFRSIAGTAAAPGMSFVGDTDNGIFAPLADTLAFGTSASEKMRILANGKVGVGTTNPNSGFEVANDIRSSGINAAFILANPGGSARTFELGTDGSSSWMKNLTNSGGVFAVRSNTNTEPFSVSYNAPAASLSVISSGNVGIGVTAPTRLLQVAGAIKITPTPTPGTPTAGDIFVDSSSSNSLKYHNGSSWQTLSAGASSPWEVNGNNISYSAGNVGFGTTSPIRPIHISGSSSATMVFERTSNAVNLRNRFLSHAMPGLVFGSANDDMTGQVVQMTLAPSGFLGIGTSTPRAPLDVTSTTTVSNLDTSNIYSDFSVAPSSNTPNSFSAIRGAATVTTSNLGTSGGAFGGHFSTLASVSGTNSSFTGVYGKSEYTGAGTLSNSFGGDFTATGSGFTSNAWGIRASVSTTTSTNAKGLETSVTGTVTNGYGVYVGNVAGTTSRYSLFASDSAAPSFFAGNLGIGISNPSRRLQVAGAMKITPTTNPGTPTAGDIFVDSSSSNSLKYHNGSNWVSIGSGSGDFLADGSVPMTGQFRSIAGTAAAPGLTFAGDTDNGIFSPALDNFAISTSGSEKLRVLANGNVGIGLTAPTAPLELRGTDPNSITANQQLRIQGSSTSGAAESGAGINFAFHDGVDVEDFGVIRVAKSNATANNEDSYMQFGIKANNGSVSEAMRINPKGTVSINSNILTSAQLSLRNDETNVSNEGILAQVLGTSATNGTHWVRGMNINAYDEVRTGITNSGSLTGLQVNATRINNATDRGTLSNIFGIYASYGTGQSGGSPVTGNIYGIYLSPLLDSGTSTSNLYDLYIANGSVSAGTVTNRWGIYQAGTARNSFGGAVGIGTTSPSRLLSVNGSMNLAPSALPSTPAAGDIFVDSGAANALKYHNGSNWVSIGSGAGNFMADGSVPMTGQFRSIAGTTAAPGMTFIGDTNTGFSLPAVDAVGVSTAGLERVRFLANGNVGIGSTGAPQFLTVSSNQASSALASFTNKNANGYSGLMFNDNADVWQAGIGYGNASAASFASSLYINSANSNPITFGVSNAERMRLTGTGLGIGTTTPSRLFQVAGAMKITPTANPGTPTAGDIFVDSSATNTLKYHNGSAWVSLAGGGGDFMANGTVPMTGQLRSSAGTITNPGLTFVGSTNTGIYAPATNELALTTSGLERIHILSSGAVGIGLSNPNAALEVSGAIRVSNGIVSTSSGGASTPIFTFHSDQNTGLFQPAYGTFAISTLSNERMRFLGNGNIGIGLTTPTRLLQVAGAMKITPTANPGTPTAGDIFVDSSATNTLKYHNGSAWVSLAGGGTGDFMANGSVPMTGQFRSILGSATAPGMSFSGDTNTGVYSPGADTIAIGTSGVERIRIEANGQVGVGTAPIDTSVFSTLQARTDTATGWISSNYLRTSLAPTSTSAAQLSAAYFENTASGSQAMSQIMGAVFDTTMAGSNTLDQSLGAVSVNFQSAGTITTAIGYLAYPQQTAGLMSTYIAYEAGTGNRAGTVANSYGVFIEDMQSTTSSYGIYQKAGTDQNFFAGSVGIGVTVPNRILQTSGAIRINPTANPGSPAAGDLFFDSAASNVMKYHNGSSWVTVGGGGDFLANGTVPMTGTLRHVAGTAALPGLTFAGDTDNGIFAPAADNIALTTSGSEKLRMLANGAVGLGMSTPKASLQIAKASNPTTISTANEYLHLGGAEQIANDYRLIGFGLSTAETQSAAYMGFKHTSVTGSGNGALVFGTRNVTTDTAPSERMRIDAAGNVGIGMTNPSVALDVNGDIEYTGTITDVSDRRLKENITPIDDSLAMIRELPVYSYTMKGDEKKRLEYGVMAQDLRALVPNLTSVIDQEKGYIGVNYIGLIPWSIRAIQQVDREVASVKAENQVLKSRLDKLEEQNKILADQVQKLIDLHNQGK